jgi:hypothetical protein
LLAPDDIPPALHLDSTAQDARQDERLPPAVEELKDVAVDRRSYHPVGTRMISHGEHMNYPGILTEENSPHETAWTIPISQTSTA